MGFVTPTMNIPVRLAIANNVAEPAFWVNHQMSANSTNEDPNSDSACPDQIVKKRSC